MNRMKPRTKVIFISAVVIVITATIVYAVSQTAGKKRKEELGVSV